MSTKKFIACSTLLIFSIFGIIVFASDIPTDDQIAKILMTTNDGEVSMAKLAKEKSQNKEVKEFAGHMIKDHSKSNKNSSKLAHKIGLKPIADEKAKEMKMEAAEKIAKLKNLKGTEFDKAYIDDQIEMHQKVLGDLDNSLIPSAKNEKLKKMLEKTRKTVADHLEDAQKIKSSLQ